MEWLLDPHLWVAFATLTALEIVLGIDNIIFISILVGRLPREQQPRARFLGLGLAMVMRILLLLSLAWVMSLTEELFAVAGYGVSGRDMILFGGGLFLIGKATLEIHEALEGDGEHGEGRGAPSFLLVLVQIAVIDIVFSLDSVITAVGLVDEVPVMIAAIVVAILVMMAASGAISRFVERHPTFKILALSFLVLIGTALVAEAFGMHVSKGYLYFAMAFSVTVELLNLRVRRRVERPPVHLRRAYEVEEETYLP
jgi:predicted tellurium resistance membrane protein TerC